MQGAQVLVERLLVLPVPPGGLHLHDCTRRALKCVCKEEEGGGGKEAGNGGRQEQGERTGT